MVAAGKSPANEKARAKARTKGAETFDAWAEKCLRGYRMRTQSETCVDQSTSVS